METKVAELTVRLVEADTLPKTAVMVLDPGLKVVARPS